MSADLKIVDVLTRQSLLVEPTCLVVLEHQTLSDRMRRVLFDRVESVTVWRGVLWGRVILILLLMLPAALLLLIDDPVARGIALTVLLCTGLALLYYLWCGKTRIRIVRDGEERAFTAIAPPGRVRRFRDKLEAAIRADQARARAEAQASVEPSTSPVADDGVV